MRINGDRLWQRLMQMAQIGATPKGGVRRVALTDVDRLGRDLFIDWVRAQGCSVRVDQMGNIFARREGRQPERPPILIGSHLDSQPTGGKFDGVLGVLAGLEIVETLNKQQYLTEHPLEIVSWTNEEGARFAPAMVSSGVFAGVFSLAEAHAATDQDGLKLGDELERIGYRGDIPVGGQIYHAAFELHIEQGPILEAEDMPIGVVTGVQGIRWYDIVLKGQETHAGPCPMYLRRDPVRGLQAVLRAVYELAESYAPEARVTVGAIKTLPGVRNTVPATVSLTLDIRHPDGETLQAMHQTVAARIADVTSQQQLAYELKQVWHAPPVAFHPACIAAVARGAETLALPHRKIVSGAGHDAVYLARVMPTSMIFIPCKDGLSHNELESCEPAHVTAGADVLLQAILQIDHQEDLTS